MSIFIFLKTWLQGRDSAALEVSSGRGLWVQQLRSKRGMGDDQRRRIAQDIAQGIAQGIAYGILGSGGAWLCWGAGAGAQPVQLDGSTSSSVMDALSGLPSDCSLNCLIQGSDRAGGNLFHSFSEFNVERGVTVTFDGIGIERILTRVTGGNRSQIDGILQVQGNADLFLLNPAGLVIGPEGRLDLSGSFIGSTAQTLEFANGDTFATTETGPPLLSLSVPSGLQLGSLSSGQIEVQGDSTNLPLAQPGTVGQTLALIGASNAPLTWSQRSHAVSAGGLVLANGNHSGSQQATLQETGSGWAFDFSAGQWNSPIVLDEVQLTSLAEQPGGTINLRGNLTITDSNITLESDGVTPAGNFDWRGDRLVLDETELKTLTSAGGGDINLLSQNTIDIRDDSLISVASLGPGAAGNITLEALGLGLSLLQSQISSSVETEGGNISLLSPLGMLFDQGELFASTAFDGANVSLDTNGLITLTDRDFISVSSGDGTNAGSGGNLAITAFFVYSLGRDTDIKVVGPAGNFDTDIQSFVPFVGFGNPAFTTVIRGNGRSEIQVTELPPLSTLGRSPSPSPPVTLPPTAIALPPSVPLLVVVPPSSQPIPVTLPSLIGAEPEDEPPVAQQPPLPPLSDPSATTQPSQSSESEVGLSSPLPLGENKRKTIGEIGDRPNEAVSARAPRCNDDDGDSRLRISGRGGIAAPPGRLASSSPSLADLGPATDAAAVVALPQRNHSAQATASPPLVASARPWIEAQGWQRSDRGKIELLPGPGVLPPAKSLPCQPLS